MFEIASDWDRSVGARCELRGFRSESDDITDDETDVGDAGDSDRCGDTFSDDVVVVPDVGDDESLLVNGALYVQTIRWSSVSLSGRVSSNVFNEEVTSSSISIETADIDESLWN